MNSLQELKEHLNSENKSNKIVLHTCVADNDKRKWRIVQALQPHIIGIKMTVIGKISAKNTVQCVREKVEEKLDIEPLDDDEAEEPEEDCSIEMREHGEMKDFDPTDVSAKIMYASVGLVAMIFTAGSAWHLTRSHDQEKKEEGTVCNLVIYLLRDTSSLTKTLIFVFRANPLAWQKKDQANEKISTEKMSNKITLYYIIVLHQVYESKNCFQSALIFKIYTCIGVKNSK